MAEKKRNIFLVVREQVEKEEAERKAAEKKKRDRKRAKQEAKRQAEEREARETAWGQRRRDRIREQGRDFDTRYRLRQEGVNLAPAPLPKPEDLLPYNDLREQVRERRSRTRTKPETPEEIARFNKAKDAAWRAKMNKQSTEREKRMAQYDRVEDAEFKRKRAAEDKWYKEARARIAANNEKLKRMGLL